MKQFLSPIAALLLNGCTDIPEQTMTLDADLNEKLNKVQSVHLIPNPKLFTTKCRFFDGTRGYYVVSGQNNLSDDYAMWKCASEIRHLKCPDLKVTSVNGQALIQVGEGSMTDYSKDQVLHCAREAVRHAVTELLPTSDEVANRASW